MKKICIICILFGLVFCFYSCDNNRTTDAVTMTDTPIEKISTTTSSVIPTTTTDELVDFSLAEGLYNFKFVSSEIKETFMASAETFLLDNMYAGIPLYNTTDYLVYSNRVSLPVLEYVALIGYGDKFGELTEDDSTVLMSHGEHGNVGEYTFRSTVNSFGITFNHWFNDISATEDIMELYVDRLYNYEVNETANGFDLVPSMADSEPLPLSPVTNEFGETVSFTWQIPLRDDLTWYFSDDTSQTFINSLDESNRSLTADDFLNTYKLAIDEHWFRATSGGTLIDSIQIIEGLSDYQDGLATWEDVGIEVINNNLQFTFIYEQSAWNVMYYLSNIYTSPVNMALYNYLEADGDSNTFYGSSYSTIAYCGPYYIDSYIGDILTLNKNPHYYDQNKYFYTGYEFHIESNYEAIKSLYDQGYLDFFKVNIDDHLGYVESSQVMTVPQGSNFALNINASGSSEVQTTLFPDSNYIPEPLLANKNFRLAMYYAIDRNSLVDNIEYGIPSNRYITEGFITDIKEGVSYVNSTQGMAVLQDRSPLTCSYDLSKAQNYFNLALEELILNGDYVEGIENDYTVININLQYIDSDSHEILANFLKDSFESIFISEDYYISINVSLSTVDFPSIYFDNMSTGEFDMFIGGFSNSLLCPNGILEHYCSDNRTGFLLNFGYDTSEAEIEVRYTDMDGLQRAEIWSYDAITSALMGDVYVHEGQECIYPGIEVIETTSTTLTFNITNFNESLFENLTYTIYRYDSINDIYVELPGYINIDPTEYSVTISGLTPHYYWYNQEGETYYQSGDYRVELTYDYIYYSDRSESFISSWILTESIQPESVTNTWSSAIATEDRITLDLTPDSMYSGMIVSLTLTEYDEFNEVTTAIIDQSNISAVLITNLTPDSSYVLWITYDDGFIDAIRFKTSASTTTEQK